MSCEEIGSGEKQATGMGGSSLTVLVYRLKLTHPRYGKGGMMRSIDGSSHRHVACGDASSGRNGQRADSVCLGAERNKKGD